MTNRSRDALQQWNFSLRFNPQDDLALVCLGRLYLHQNEFLKAIECFKKVLVNKGANSEGKKLNLVDAYIRASSITEARSMLASVEGMGDNPRLHYLWGMLHYRSNDFTLSFASFRRCIALGRERNHELLSQIQWPSDYTSDEEFNLLISSINPTLESVFDAFNMLKSSESTPDAGFDDVTDFINE